MFNLYKRLLYQWHIKSSYEDKFGWYQLAAGVFLLLQPHRGIAWFIESQLPFLTAQAFGVMMIISGVALVAIDGRVSVIDQYRYKRWPMFVWFLYIAMSLIAAVRPFPPSPLSSNLIEIPGVVVVIYLFTADILVSQLMRLRENASTAKV